MTLYTDLFPDEAQLLGRTWLKQNGSFNVVVPDKTKTHAGKDPSYCRAHALGVGGQGQYWGGSGARARSLFTVSPGENLVCQVGVTATALPYGDTWVKRNNGTLLLYADRGRGDGPAGLAANSFGDKCWDGQPGNQGGAGGDLAALGEYAEVMPAWRGADYQFQRAGQPGCGGHGAYITDAYGNLIGHTGWYGGMGLIVLEWFDINPNY